MWHPIGSLVYYLLLPVVKESLDHNLYVVASTWAQKILQQTHLLLTEWRGCGMLAGVDLINRTAPHIELSKSLFNLVLSLMFEQDGKVSSWNVTTISSTVVTFKVIFL